MYDVLIKDRHNLSAQNFANPDLKFSWAYRQTAHFRQHFRPSSLVQSREGGPSTFSHGHAPTSTRGGAGTRPETAMVNFSAGPPKRGSDFAGGDPRAWDQQQPDARDARPGHSDEQFAMEFADEQVAGNLHTSMKGAKTIVNSNTIKIK